MTGRNAEEEFAEYAADALARLRRIAYLLCHDWHRADDLTQNPSAGTVRGHQAWWNAAPGSGQASAAMRLVLMWHYAPGAWASIDYYNGTTDATAAAMLLRVADNATLAFSEDGSGVMVSAAGAEYQAIGGESGLIAVARSLTWLGSNPAHWTTNAVG